jgi:YVTN family beta-propeller protein
MVRRVEIGILGPLRFAVDGVDVRLPAKLQVLLAVLALEPGTVSTDRLLIALWGEDVAPNAQKTLQSHVFQLRRALAAGTTDVAASAAADQLPGPGTEMAAIITDGRGYRLQADAAVVDARRFETLVATARGQRSIDPRAAVDALAEALSMWRGNAAADVGDEPIATAAIERLVELRHGAFDELVELRLALGEASDVIPELRRELRAYPYREPLWGSLMRALDASGRRAEALLAYREASEALRRELDVEPDDELTLLAERIRTGTNEPPAGPAAVAQGHGDAAVPNVAALVRPTRETHRARRLRLGAAAATLGLVLALVLILRWPLAAPAGPTSGPGSSLDPSASLSQSVAGRVELLDADGQVSETAALGVSPDGIVAGQGSLWVTDPTDGEVLRVDEATQAVVQRIDVGNRPAGIAYGFGAVWVANSDGRTVTRIDPTTDEVVATINVGTAPEGVATDGRWVWVTNRLDHSLTRIDPSDGSTRSFAVGTTPLGVAVANGSVWVVDGGAGAVAQIDPATGSETRSIAVGSDPTSIAASPEGDAVWVTNSGSGTVFRIDTESAAVTAAQTVGTDPTGIAVEGNGVWVAVSGTNEVVRLDPVSAAIMQRTTLSGSPRSLTADGGGVAVTSDAAASAHEGGVLHVVTPPGGMTGTVDPSYEEWESEGITVLTYDGLVDYKRVGGPDGLTLVPDLAAQIPVAQDGGRTWAFRLRPGLVYSDGEPVRASDAVGSFERAAMGGIASQTGAGLFGNTEIIGSAACGAAPPCDLSSGITTDDQAATITFHLTAPDPAFPSRIAWVPMVPAMTPLTETSALIPGTGPYRIASFRGGASERLIRNPLFHVWSQDAQPDGNLDEIDVYASANADPTVDVLSGAADVLQIGTESPQRLAQLRTEVPAQLHVDAPDQTWEEEMNTTLPPFDDVRVRQAVNLATDRDALVEDWGGPLTASVTCQAVPPGFAGYQRYCPWTVDPNPNGNWLGPDLPRARQLIDDSGTRGESVTVWGLADGGQHATVAGYFAGLLRDLGYQATTHLVDFNGYFSEISEHPEEVQITGSWTQAGDRLASDTIVGGFTCPSYPDVPYEGHSQWCDPALDARVQAALALQDIDPIGADADWAAIDHSIVDAAPAVMAFNPTYVTMLSPRPGGYEEHPYYAMLYDQMWVH